MRHSRLSPCNKKINILLVLSFLGLIQTAHASEIQYTPQDAQEIIYSYAVDYGIQSEPFYKTLQCESGLDPSIQSKDYHDGVREQSWGIAQINLPYHTGITKAEATDPIWAINWAAEQFSKGNQKEWSCYRMLYPQGDNGV